MENRSFHEVVVIGAGVSGMTCAMYLARANVDVCLIGDYTTTPLLSTPSIQNYPGIGNISGMEFLENLHKQVLESGACIVEANAMAPMIKDDGWIILTDNGDIIDTKNIVVSTGSSARMLNLENEEEFIGKGVSTCAYCDGSLYEGKDVCVVGSGTLAIEEAMYLAKICRRVTVLCRKSEFSTSVYTPDQLNKYDNIAVLFDANVAKIVGSGEKIMVILAGTRSRIVSFDGIFYAIGSSPNTSFLEKLYPLDNNGYIDLPDEVSTKHHMYACGDVNASNRFKQVVTAASDGCNTALKILKDLRNK